MKRVPFPPLFGALSPRREGNAGTANFYLNVPTGRKVHLWAEINADKAWPESDHSNNRHPATGTVDVEFKQRKPLSVGYVLVDYHPRHPSAATFPKFAGKSKPDAAWAASASAHAFLDAVFPTASPNYYKLGTGWLAYKGIDVRYDTPQACARCDLLKKLTKDWQAWKLSGKPVPDQIFAWLPAKATDAVSWDGVADAPPPVYTGAGRAALGEEGSGELLAHEVAHNLKLFHAPCPPPPGHPNTPKGIDPQWPYSDGFIQEVGFDVAHWRTKTPGAPDFSADFMSYCVFQWISPYHWKKLFDELTPSSGHGGVAVFAPQSYALISGVVRDDNTGQLDPLMEVESVAEAPSPPTGSDYCVAFDAASGATLATYCFDVSFANPESGEATSVAAFAFALPYPAGASGMTLRRENTVLDERVVTAHAPEIVLDAPRGDEVWDGVQTVAWTASDMDGDALTFAVFYSADDGMSASCEEPGRGTTGLGEATQLSRFGGRWCGAPRRARPAGDARLRPSQHWALRFRRRRLA
ncbi:MAG: hypothetical protein ACE5I7_15955 [Candidatus Binatia bacterium]